MNQVNTKKLALNTIFLYSRMFILMLVTFYTSRVLLKELGVEDYGIYGIVGGIVALFSSLRGLFATATQRFLNFEMGKGNMNALNQVFNMSIFINICICIIFFIITETFGLWFLKNKLVIDPERLEAAYWVFHCSVIAAMISILTIPFDAIIIANERMSIYAYLSILDAILRLAIIFILPFVNIDKLIAYAVLVILVSLIIRSLNSIYCKRTFPECKYKFYWSKDLFKEMATFAGWNFAGNLAFAMVNEGLNILLNIFGGVVANAARSIAYQIKNAITMLLNNAVLAIEPQATKSYAKGEKNTFLKILFTISKVIAYLYLLIGFPLYFYTENILQIWLNNNIPEGSIIFIQGILIYLAIRSFHQPIDIFFFITGNLKKYQTVELCILTLTLPVSYIGLKFYNMPLDYVFVVMSLIEIINLACIILIAHKTGEFNLKQYINSVWKYYIITFIISYLLIYSIYLVYNLFYITNNIYSIIPIFVSIIVLIGIIFVFGFSSAEKEIIKKHFKKRKHE